MKNINNLGYFERQALIDLIGRKIVEEQGWKVEREGDIRSFRQSSSTKRRETC